MQRDAIEFSEAQRKILEDQGVIGEQIEALKVMMPLCRALWTNAAPMADVRDELAKLADLLHRSSDLVTKLEKSHQKPIRKGSREAYSRLLIALHDMGVDFDKIHVLYEIRDAADRALADLSRGGQRRPYSANPQPVQKLHRALLNGWAKKQHIKRYPHVPSSNPDSAFYTIVCVCYEAFTGIPDIDPERAISTFLQQYKRQHQKELTRTRLLEQKKSRTRGHKKT